MDLYYHIALEQLSALPESTRLVFIHPNLPAPNKLLHSLLGQDGVYVRLTAEPPITPAFIEQIAAQMSPQPIGTQILVLDEADRVTMPTLVTLLSALFAAPFAANLRVIVISRVIPNSSLLPSELLAMTQMLPVYPPLMLFDYCRSADATPLIEVRGFGHGRVYLNGQEITQWDGYLPRALFFYLVDHGIATRNDIFEIFWSKLTTKEATNVFHVTKRKLSEVFGLDMTTYTSGFYRIADNIEVRYDVTAFSQAVQDSLMAEPDVALNHLLHAVELFQVDFLASVSLPWVEEKRQSLLQTYGEALVALTRLGADTGTLQRVAGLFLRGMLHSPHREEIAQHVMMEYVEQGFPGEALALYDRIAMEKSEHIPATLQAFANRLRQQAS